MQAVAFYLFAAIVLVSGALVVTSRNPVHAVLWLIVAFFNAAGLMVLVGAEFIAMLLVIVYVGAVAVLFLFVVMMLDIDFAQLRQGFQRYAPIGAVIGGILFLELLFVFGAWQSSGQAGALRLNPMPKRKLPGTDTPVDVQKQIVRRHAAVLGLGALVEAFPYATPPPKWMPEVLALLATRAANDPGVVGKATKGILSEFKKTRQDSWGVDQKVCSLCRWHFYFAVLNLVLTTLCSISLPSNWRTWKEYYGRATLLKVTTALTASMVDRM